MALDDLTLNHVLVVERNRVKINWCGLKPIIYGTSSQILPDLQFADLYQLASIIICIGVQSPTAMRHPSKALEGMSTIYSKELVEFLSYLMGKAKSLKIPSAMEACRLIAHRMVLEMRVAYTVADATRYELSKEFRNGRLFRLLVKLGFINERPEYQNNPRWSETEDRYVLKLFRDFLFHTVNDDGTANVDLGHVVDTLNKLDVGSPEKTLLTSRTNDSMLVVSYADLARCVEEAFNDLQTEKPSEYKSSEMGPSGSTYGNMPLFVGHQSNSVPAPNFVGYGDNNDLMGDPYQPVADEQEELL